MSVLNFYEVLNVKPDATEKDIKKAYRILAKKYHPDTYDGNKAFAEEKMQEINIAYDTLSNENLRKSYDEKIGVNLKKDEEVYTSSNQNTTSKTQYYKNPYNKSGVNYEVKYRPNNSRIKYDSRGYAESNYYTTGMDEEEYYSKYDYNFKKAKIKELLSGKNLIYTLTAILIVIVLFSLAIYKVVESINELLTSTQTISEKINSSKEESKKASEENEKVLKETIYPALDDFTKNLKEKEQEFINEYKKNKNDKDKREILNEWGITDSEAQKEILELIEELNKN